jgi:hypothetical protein
MAATAGSAMAVVPSGALAAAPFSGVTCTLKAQTTSLSPPIPFSGGSGTYSMSGDTSVGCLNTGDNVGKSYGFTSSGTYTSTACGSTTLTGTYALVDPTPSNTITGNITITSVAGGLAYITASVGGSRTGSGGGGGALEPASATGANCASSLTFAGQVGFQLTS